MSENKFGYKTLFDTRIVNDPSDDDLNKLSAYMTKPRKDGIPAGYTYLGQFIDHDITLDSAAGIFPWNSEIPDEVRNLRTPFLDLETIYGHKIPSNPGEPERSKLLAEGSQSLLKLGDTVKGEIEKRVFIGKDLPRMPDKPDAIIVDKRNDENLAVAQTQVAFMRFHNAVVKYLDSGDSTKTFETARRIVIQHYQWIILNDYLPRVIKRSVLTEVLDGGRQFYFPEEFGAYMPLEFSVAAFRFGHSMIRNSYNWNRLFNEDQGTFNAGLNELIKFTGKGGLDGKNNLVSDWLINWNWFFKTRSKKEGLKFNNASEIDTKMASFLGQLPTPGGGQPGIFRREASLPAFDLYRSRRDRLPSGQAVAKAIYGTAERVLTPRQIANLLPPNLKSKFSEDTPLWFYLLAEAEIEEHGQNLGEVGSRIIAETFSGLIEMTDPSILKNGFRPNPDFHVSEKEFGMRQMLRFVADSEGDQGYDALNPLG